MSAYNKSSAPPMDDKPPAYVEGTPYQYPEGYNSTAPYPEAPPPHYPQPDYALSDQPTSGSPDNISKLI